MIDIAPLKQLLPVSVYKELMEVATKCKINSPLRMAHFLAQCAHESQNFQRTEENLNYSLEALLRVFRKYFKRDEIELYVHKPEKIASRVYANRMGNGDEESQDGWIYRGRGFIQLTGKSNYAAFDRTVPEDIIDDPEMVMLKYPLLSAAWFWNENKLNEIADQGATENEVAAITKKVNGGFHGLENRHKLFDRYYTALR